MKSLERDVIAATQDVIGTQSQHPKDKVNHIPHGAVQYKSRMTTQCVARDLFSESP